MLVVGRIVSSSQLTGHLALEPEVEASLLSFPGPGFFALAGHFRIIFEMIDFLIKSLKSHIKRVGLSFRNLLFYC